MRTRTPAPDAGFSLVELAVYIVVLGLISTIIAVTMVSLFRSEATVSGLTTSASDAQNAATQLRADIRNAREFRVTDSGATVTASVAGRTATLSWQCVRWQVAGSGDDRAVTRSTRPDSPASSWAAPGMLVTGVTERTTGAMPVPYFVGGASPGVQGNLAYSWRIATADNGSIDVVGNASSRTQGQVDIPSTTCFS